MQQAFAYGIIRAYARSVYSRQASRTNWSFLKGGSGQALLSLQVNREIVKTSEKKGRAQASIVHVN